LDRLDNYQILPQTIIYNLNPTDNASLAAMLGNFSTGPNPAKIQLGPAWWFLDQKDGIENHLNIISNLSLLAHFIGMTTDSRSFLSYPRHEYFRRILCNLIGDDVEKGLLPRDTNILGEIIQNICYQNPKNYFAMECG
ncbi:MAG: glucuronate isomerase, partial [Planctomycetes bacterium]|nr:glucuronate isomerase [Planctomycetota bacterium]